MAGLAVAVLILAIVLANKGGGSGQGTAAQPLATNAPTMTTPEAVDSQITSSGPSQDSTAPSVEPTVPAPVQLEAYNGPGGVSVQGPTGWSNDTSAGLSTVADYDAPGSTARLAGSTFRIGISNPSPNSDIHTEGLQAANFLRSTFHATIIGSVTPHPFLGTDCADVEYRYFNTTYSLERRGIERIWHAKGQTYTIQSSGPASDWSQTQEVFRELISEASVN